MPNFDDSDEEIVHEITASDSSADRSDSDEEDLHAIDDSDDSDSDESYNIPLSTRATQVLRTVSQPPTLLSREFLTSDNIDAIIDSLAPPGTPPTFVYKLIARWCATHKSACKDDTFYRALRAFNVDTTNVSDDVKFQIVPVLWSGWKAFFADVATLFQVPLSENVVQMWAVLRWGLSHAGARNGDGIWCPMNAGTTVLYWLSQRVQSHKLTQRQLDGLLEGLATGYAHTFYEDNNVVGPEDRDDFTATDLSKRKNELIQWHIKQWFKNNTPLQDTRVKEYERTKRIKRHLGALSQRGPYEDRTTLWAFLVLRGAGQMTFAEYDSLDRQMYALVWKLLRAVRNDVPPWTKAAAELENPNPLDWDHAVEKEIAGMLEKGPNLRVPQLYQEDEAAPLWLQTSGLPRLPLRNANRRGFLQVHHMALCTGNPALVEMISDYLRSQCNTPWPLVLVNDVDYLALVEFAFVPSRSKNERNRCLSITERLLGEVVDQMARDYAEESALPFVRSRARANEYWNELVFFANAVFDGLLVKGVTQAQVTRLKSGLMERWQAGGGEAQGW